MIEFLILRFMFGCFLLAALPMAQPPEIPVVQEGFCLHHQPPEGFRLRRQAPEPYLPAYKAGLPSLFVPLFLCQFNLVNCWFVF